MDQLPDPSTLHVKAAIECVMIAWSFNPIDKSHLRLISQKSFKMKQQKIHGYDIFPAMKMPAYICLENDMMRVTFIIRLVPIPFHLITCMYLL